MYILAEIDYLVACHVSNTLRLKLEHDYKIEVRGQTKKMVFLVIYMYIVNFKYSTPQTYNFEKLISLSNNFKHF